MKVRAFAATLLVTLSVWQLQAARAQTPDPQTRALAQQLLDVVMTRDLQKNMVDNSWPAAESAIRKAAPKLTDAQIGDLKTEYVSIVGREMETLLADAPDIYARYLTAAEIKDLLAFYQTETGKKTISIMPALMGEIMEKVQSQLPRMQQNLMTSFQRVLEQKGVKL